MNCVFPKLVIISSDDLEELVIDNCIFMGGLKVYGTKEGVNSISIVASNFEYLEITDRKVNEIRISQSKINLFKLLNIRGSEIITINNYINKFDIESVSYQIIDFDDSQVNLDYYSSFRKVKNINLFTFIDIHNDGTSFEDSSFKEKILSIEFLRKNTSIEFNKDRNNQLKYYEEILFKKNKLEKVLMLIIGSLVKPLRILLLASLIIMIYSLIYIHPSFKFSVRNSERSLEFIESLYFSGLTFVTISYGDIQPIGIPQLVAFSQGMLGIIVASLFVIALVRRYLD